MQKTVSDDLRRSVTFEFPPRRLISLCPSLTETLFALGAGDFVVGRTSYCVHPQSRVQAVPTVGGTKEVDIDLVASLEPDLVIAAKEENSRQTVETLAGDMPIYVTDVTDFDGALRAIKNLGILTGRTRRAAGLVRKIRTEFDRLRTRARHRVAYLVWQNPYLAAGSGTYIHAMLEKCGLENVCAALSGRYPKITISELRRLTPTFVMLPTEPFAFADKHAIRIAQQLPQAQIVHVDGEVFGWYGSRMLQTPGYFQQLSAKLDAMATMKRK